MTKPAGSVRDKHGRARADTGYGCGCTLCAAAGAPRYERRTASRSPATARSPWSPLRRRLVSIAEALLAGRRQTA